jgi:hypothetical protein
MDLETILEAYRTFQQTPAVQAYIDFQENHPVLGPVMTGEIIFTIGDVVLQTSEYLGSKVRRIWNKEAEIKPVRLKKTCYTMAFAWAYGLAIDAMIKGGEKFGNFCAEHSEWVKNHDAVVPLIKALSGPTVWGVPYNSVVMENNAIGEKKENDYSLSALGRHYRDLIKNWPKNAREGLQHFRENYLAHIPHKAYVFSSVGTFTGWVGFHYFNYPNSESGMMVTAALAVGIAWAAALHKFSREQEAPNYTPSSS